MENSNRSLPGNEALKSIFAAYYIIVYMQIHTYTHSYTHHIISWRVEAQARLPAYCGEHEKDMVYYVDNLQFISI